MIYLYYENKISVRTKSKALIQMIRQFDDCFKNNMVWFVTVV